jgi:glycosyltransferase involved in cell wall biosynthesis
VDAIYERHSLFGASGVRAAAALGLAHVLELNAPLREEAARYRVLPHAALAAELESEVFAGTRQILAVSAALADTLVAGGVTRDKIRVVPNGVDVKRFRAGQRRAGPLVAGFAGSLKPWHGIETLVEAVVRVPEVRLEVVGHGPLEELLERIPAAQLTHRGALPHAAVAEAMAGWDVGLAPYLATEGFWFSPLKVLEYMAAGVCTVASDVGELADTLGYGERGVLVPAGDVQALAAALSALASDPAKARRLGSRARTWVGTHRAWTENARSVLDALREPALEALT